MSFYKKYTINGIRYFEVDKSSVDRIGCYNRDRPCNVKHIRSELVALNPTVDKSEGYVHHYELTTRAGAKFKKIGARETIWPKDLVSKYVVDKKPLQQDH